jgi:hypothetical protein
VQAGQYELTMVRGGVNRSAKYRRIDERLSMDGTMAAYG